MTAKATGKRETTQRPGIYKVTRRKGVVYVARYRAVDPDTGQRVQYSGTFDRMEEAEAWLDDKRQARRVGTHISPTRAKRTFGDLAEQWLAAKPRKARTMEGYRVILGSRLAAWKDRPVSAIDYDTIQAVIGTMRNEGLAAQTVRNVYNVARAVLDEAVDSGSITVNPALRLRKKLPARGGERAAQFLTAQQVAALTAQLASPHDLVVRLAAWSGLRAGEIAGLRVRNVDPLRARIRVEETVIEGVGGVRVDTPKSAHSRREVPIPPTLARELADHIADCGLAPEDYVFGRNGQPLRHNIFYVGSFKPAALRIGLPTLRFHDLRHTYASLMAQQGRSMYEVSRWMGHSTYRITADTYTHLFEGDDPDLSSSLDAAYLGGSKRATRTVLPFPTAQARSPR